MLLHAGLQLKNHKGYQQLILVPMELDIYLRVMILRQINYLVLFVVAKDRKNSYPTNHKELEQNIKEHLKWRNKNRHDQFLKKLQKRIYVI